MAEELSPNQKKLNDLHWQITAEGREFNYRYLLSELQFPNAWGDKFSFLTILNGVERRSANIEAMLKAQVENLVKAVAAVAGGEKFDEAKLLEGVRAAAAAGTADAIKSIETTVTIQKEG